MIILFVYVFAAPQFIPEYLPEEFKNVAKATDIPADNDYWKTISIKRQILVDHPNPKFRDWNGKLVLDGTPKEFDGTPGYLLLKNETASRHLTTVFNMFVWFQIINMICSRKINDELAVFAGIFDNWLFVVIFIAICALQVIMVQLAGRVMKVHNMGLTGEQWLFTTIPAFLVFIFNAILKFVPDWICPVLGDEEESDKEKAKKEYMNLRKSRDLSSSLRQGGFVHNK